MSDIRFVVLVFRDSSDYILEPFSWFDSISFASCDERVDHRGSYSRCIAATEEIVLASLCWQVIYVGIIILCVDNQYRFWNYDNIIYNIAKASSNGYFKQNDRENISKPKQGATSPTCPYV